MLRKPKCFCVGFANALRRIQCILWRYSLSTDIISLREINNIFERRRNFSKTDGGVIWKQFGQLLSVLQSARTLVTAAFATDWKWRGRPIKGRDRTINRARNMVLSMRRCIMLVAPAIEDWNVLETLVLMARRMRSSMPIPYSLRMFCESISTIYLFVPATDCTPWAR